MLRKPCLRLLAVRLVAVREHEVDAGGTECARNAETDSGNTTGDQRRLALPVHAVFPLTSYLTSVSVTRN